MLHPLEQQLQAIHSRAVGGWEVIAELAQQLQPELGESRKAVSQALLLQGGSSSESRQEQGPRQLCSHILKSHCFMWLPQSLLNCPFHSQLTQLPPHRTYGLLLSCPLCSILPVPTGPCCPDACHFRGSAPSLTFMASFQAYSITTITSLLHSLPHRVFRVSKPYEGKSLSLGSWGALYQQHTDL